MEQKKNKQKTSVIVMAGARMKEVKKRGKKEWVFPLIIKKTKEGKLPVEVSGGDIRMRAVSIIYQGYLKSKRPNENLLILVTGGREKSGHSRSFQAKKKLVKDYNIPREIIKSLGGKGSTLGNVKAVFSFIKKNKKLFSQIKEIEIVTNDFHIIRAWLMFSFESYKLSRNKNLKIKNQDIKKIKKILDKSLGQSTYKEAMKKIESIMKPYLSQLSFKVKPIIAENIIASSGLIGKVYREFIIRNKWFQKTRKLEKKGIIDFLNGRYK